MGFHPVRFFVLALQKVHVGVSKRKVRIHGDSELFLSRCLFDWGFSEWLLRLCPFLDCNLTPQLLHANNSFLFKINKLLFTELFVMNRIEVFFLLRPKDLVLCKTVVLFYDEINSMTSDTDYNGNIDGTVENNSPDHLPTHERLGFNIWNVGWEAHHQHAAQEHSELIVHFNSVFKSVVKRLMLPKIDQACQV